jgi:hypothetical protein
MLFRLKLRISAILLIAGGLVAISGEVVNLFNANPTSGSWFLSLGLILLGTMLLVYGANMYAQLSESITLLGVIGVGLLFLGGVVLMVGTVAIDVVVLPLLLSLGNALASLINTMGSGVQTATNTITSGLSNLGNQISGAFGGSSSSANIPSVQIPQVSGTDLINKALIGMHLPTISVISHWGHIFLSGGPLAIGCLLLGVGCLRAKPFPRTISATLIACGGLSLVSQVLTGMLFVSNITGALLFLSLVWLGVWVLFPEQAVVSVHLPTAGSTLSRFIPARVRRQSVES